MASKLSLVFPPAPTLTEKSLPSLNGKVYIITGAASGMGQELARILYTAGATVYIAARSATRCTEGIKKIQKQVESSKGRLESLVIDLADLRTVKGAVESFLGREQKLHGLFQNAGVMIPPSGSKDKLGHDLELGTNCLGPYLLTSLLSPILTRTAAESQTFSVRVVFVVSLMQIGTPPGGMTFEADGSPKILPKPMDNYMQSKVGGCWLAAEFSERLGNAGVLCVSVNPGLMRTELQRNMPAVVRGFMGVVLKPAVYGAYSQLYSCFSDELNSTHNGGYVTAWGRISTLSKDISKGLKDEKQGGNGKAKRFIEYCEKEAKMFA